MNPDDDNLINKEHHAESVLHTGGLLSNCDDDDRKGFIIKVYSILTAQLVMTFGSVAIVSFNDEARYNLQDPENTAALAMVIVACIVALVIECMLLCCKKNARTVPINYILLFVFTACWTWIITWTCAQYDKTTVLSAALYTAVITVTLSLYACFTKADFTKLCGRWTIFALIIIITVQLMLSVISMLIFDYTETWVPLAAGFCVILYGLFLIIDTQLIIGGKRHELTIDDYVVGALILYIDIIMIFLELLKIFGR